MDELAQLQTYSSYVPQKLHIGLHHPTPIVETSALSTVPPPDVTYRCVRAAAVVAVECAEGAAV